VIGQLVMLQPGGAGRKWWLSVLLAILILGFWGAWRGMPGIEYWRTAWRPETALGAAAMAVCFVSALLLRGLRWKFLQERHCGSDRGEWLAVYGAVFALAAMTPMRAGEIARIAWLKSRGVSLSYGAGALILERLQDLVCMVLLLLAGFALMPGLSNWIGISTLLLAAMVIVMYVVLSSCALRIPRSLPKRCRSFWNETPRVKWRMARFWVGLGVLRTKRLYLSVTALGIAVWLLHALSFSLFFFAWDPNLPFFTGTMVLVIVNLGGVLHLTPGNIGPYEFIGSLVLERLGMNSGEAMVAMVLLHASTLFVVAGYGMLCWLVLYRRGGVRNRMDHGIPAA